MLKNLLFIFSLYLPFQIALNPFSSVDLASVRVLVLSLFFLWIFIGFYRKKLIIPFDRSALFVFSFLFFSAFSLLLATNPAWGMRKLAFLFSIFPLYFIFSILKNDLKWVIKISRGLVWGSSAAALVGILQFVSQFVFGLERMLIFWGKHITPIFLGNTFSQAVLENPSWLVNLSGKTIFRAISVFPDPHMFSFYMGMTAPIALAIFYHYDFQKKFYLFSFLLIILADFLTFSRGGYLALIFTVLLFSFIGIKNISKNQRHLFFIFLFLLLFFFVFLIAPVRNRFLASFSLQEGSNSGRIEMWSQALKSLQRRPLGVGLGNFPLEVKPTASYRDPIYAHNLYLDIAAETGLLGLLSWLALIVSVGYSFFHKAKQNLIYFGFLASLCVFSIHSLVETPLFSVHILSLFLIIISLANERLSSPNN
ncbi:MAG: O-antigen polymerase family protein [uncultured bacterium]|nr:MAG: O-antigen polymerase family protein [uncultured bacterium]HBR71237.1 hypothetical protein [Candidatus Moranbacteria bacterium]